MSEHWKSTPKYWCKHCKTFVKDTKFEKTNHEATPKHQGNLQRFLRNLHKDHEREEREKQRAKSEVDRLNGVVSGSGAGSTGAPWERKSTIPPLSANRQATPAERKRQLEQLAEMGIAVPEDFRRSMAMAGDWQVQSERTLYDIMSNENTVKKEDDSEDKKTAGLNIGVRKREFEGQEEEEEAGERVVKKGWGSTTKVYPGADEGEDALDALLKTTVPLKRKEGNAVRPPPPEQSSRDGLQDTQVADSVPTGTTSHPPQIKREDSTGDGAIPHPVANVDLDGDALIKQDNGPSEAGVVFKKRKAKPIRQK